VGGALLGPAHEPHAGRSDAAGGVPDGVVASYLRTAADLEYVQAAEAQHRDALDAAAYYYGEAADKNARRAAAWAAPRPVPPYERPDISSWPKPDRVGRNLTLLLAEGDRVAVN